jgi:LacI family transcriptional regulator
MNRITITDVAREAGVSTMTVSRVLNNKGEISTATRERVQRVIEQLNYRPSTVARSLATNRTQTLGLVVPDITNPFFPEIVRGAEDAASDAGYSLILCNTTEDRKRERSILELLESKRVDGVILCSARLPSESLLPLVKRYPASVLLNRQVPLEVSGVVRVDDHYGAMRAVHHLLGNHRRRIVLLAGPPSSYSGQQRTQGFRTALEATGHEVDPSLSIACSPDEAGGYGATMDLLAKNPDVDALVCYNDMVAIGALQACAASQRRVPQDVAVVGCDDIRLASLVSPSLTTLGVKKYDLGKAAVDMLLRRLRQEEGLSEIVIRPELVIRDSAP